MIIYPAIDIRNGRVVRLLYGDPNLESVYGEDPVATAQEWQQAGADWVHIVNLDGALGEETTILNIVRQIADTGLKIQFGGGIRSMDAIQQALDAGVTRVVLGTFIVQNPDQAPLIADKFGAEAITVALDAKDDQVTTHGWQSTSEWTPVGLGQKFAEAGLKHALYTDVSKDGALTGTNVEATSQLATETGLAVIASGGVASLDDVKSVQAAGNIDGVVIGRALYANLLKLEDALALAQEG